MAGSENGKKMANTKTPAIPKGQKCRRYFHRTFGRTKQQHLTNTHTYFYCLTKIEHP
jgi:hypothetical protein